MKEMKSDSWVVIECLSLLGIGLGLSFLWEPRYPFGVGMILGALIATLNQKTGVKAGSTMPQQAGDPKP